MERFSSFTLFSARKRPVVDLFKQYVAVFRQYVRRKSLFGNVANHLRKKELQVLSVSFQSILSDAIIKKTERVNQDSMVLNSLKQYQSQALTV